MKFYQFCLLLLALYGLLSSGTSLSLIQVFHRSKFSFTSISDLLYWKVSVQKQVHIIVILLCIVRILFLVDAIRVWDANDGEVINKAFIFFLCDGLSSVLFLNLSLTLTMFWAELYHLATSTEAVYDYVIKPIVSGINVGMYIILMVYLLTNEVVFSSNRYYFYHENVWALSVCYGLAAFIFALYSIYAGIEIKMAPIKFEVRKERIQKLRIMAFLFITAMIVRTAVAIAYYESPLVTYSDSSQLAVFVYFLVIEIAPIVYTLSFYGLPVYIPKDEEGSAEGSITENSPIIPPQARSILQSGSVFRTFSDIPDEQSREDIVNNIIDRLSSSEQKLGLVEPM